MDGTSIPAHIAPVWAGGMSPGMLGVSNSVVGGAPATGFRTAGSSGCWICPPPGIGQPARSLDPQQCLAMAADPSLVPPGWTVSPTPNCPIVSPVPMPASGSGSAVPPVPVPSPTVAAQPASGGTSPTVTANTSPPLAAPPPLPTVTINGQPMVCCPCTT